MALVAREFEFNNVAVLLDERGKVLQEFLPLGQPCEFLPKALHQTKTLPALYEHFETLRERAGRAASGGLDAAQHLALHRFLVCPASPR